MEPFKILGSDPANAKTHVIIEVRKKRYSVVEGSEQATADAIAAALDG